MEFILDLVTGNVDWRLLGEITLDCGIVIGWLAGILWASSFPSDYSSQSDD